MKRLLKLMTVLTVAVCASLFATGESASADPWFRPPHPPPVHRPDPGI